MKMGARPEIKRLLNLFGPFLGLILVYMFFACMVPEGSFLSAFTIKLIAVQTVIVALGAIGMTIVIISAGIDLSVGSVIALVSVVTALFVNESIPPVFCLLLGVLAGGACGLVNGLLITGLRVVPFIVTLGMMGIVRGTAKWLSNSETVPVSESWPKDLTSMTPEPSWLVLPPGLWFLILSALFMIGVLRYTPFGRHIFAVGSNEATARLCGIKVERTKVKIYLIAGLFAGMAGVMQFSRMNGGSPTEAVGLELQVIAAVVIGGGSLAGGEGSILGSLIGAFIMAVLECGCTQMDWPNYFQEIIIGAIIVAAVAVDRFRRK